MLLVAGEYRHRPLPRFTQHLVERRRQRERDADERRVEGERDERVDRQPRAAPAGLRDDDGDAGGPAAKERALLGTAVVHGAEASAALSS